MNLRQSILIPRLALLAVTVLVNPISAIPAVAGAPIQVYPDRNQLDFGRSALNLAATGGLGPDTRFLSESSGRRRTLRLPDTDHPWHGGYVVGNGRMYGVSGLDFSLTREWKSDWAERGPMSQILWVVGPHYGNANLGYGWEVLPRINGQNVLWTEERVVRPNPGSPFWGVMAKSAPLQMHLTEVMNPEQPVWLRRVVISLPKESEPVEVSFRIPVHADPRNAPKEDKDWGPKERNGHVAENELLQVRPEAAALVLKGARRRLYSEWTTHPMSQKMDHPARMLMTSVTVEGGQGTVRVDSGGFDVNLGRLRGGETRAFAVWLVTASSELEAAALLARSRRTPPEAVLSECRRQMPLPLVSRTDGLADPILDVMWGCQELCQSAQAHCGGVFASAYMYPMYYVRDQFGSFRLFLATQEYDRARRVLAYHVGMENQWGFQNSYEAVPEPPNPAGWTNAHPDQPGQGHGGAEVPSYIILMARDYYRATDDLDFLRCLYPRLAYNLRVHNFDPVTQLLPSPGDESYTQIVGIGGENFTDSNFLFIGAAEFMTQFAALLGHKKDAAEFKALADRTWAAMMKHLWMPQQGYFAISMTDRRPALDPLLRLFYLDIGDPQSAMHQGCLKAVLDNLVNPIRVVPDKTAAAGMAPGYLLYALSRSQNPEMHIAARLLTHYASDTGNMSEFYHDGTDPMGGRLRPWESGVAGWALTQYILGFHPDMAAKRILLQPHLPPGWPGWTSRPIPLVGEGELEYRMDRVADSVIFTLTRKGGKNPIAATIEFGGMEEKLTAESRGLRAVGNQDTILQESFAIPPGRAAKPFVKIIKFRVHN